MSTTNNFSFDKEEFRVRGLEGYEPAFAEFQGDMYAGLLPIDNGGDRVGRMMFWLFEPEVQEVEKSMVIWLNGGPGCSSFNCGVLMEHSPVTQPMHPAGFCCLKPTPYFQYNEKTWARATTMLYVEQPIGTGFSYGSPLPQNEEDVSRDLDMFMQNFYATFPHLATYDLFVMGESYAGMFLPSVSRYFHMENKKAKDRRDSSRINIPLAGVGIGNGWMDPRVQGPAVIDYSWWHGLIDKPTRDALQTMWKHCIENPTESQPPPLHPLNVQDDCGMMWGVLLASGFPNAYDITTWDPNVDQVTFTSEGFYNSEEVRKALHAPMNITWHGCREGEGRRRLLQTGQQLRRLYMDNDRPWSVVPYVADLVDDGIPVVIYNGDRDMTTNMVGTELLLNDMEWKGKEEWLDAPRGLWLTEGSQSGWVKELHNLTYAVVYNSGHMVPYNVPDAAYDLLLRLLRHESMIDQELPQIRAPKQESTQASMKLMTESLAGNIDGGTMGSGLASGLNHQMELMSVAAVSMVLGFLLAMWVTRRPAASGYSRVPDVQQ